MCELAIIHVLIDVLFSLLIVTIILRCFSKEKEHRKEYLKRLQELLKLEDESRRKNFDKLINAIKDTGF
jgi:hypothetical protein